MLNHCHSGELVRRPIRLQHAPPIHECERMPECIDNAFRRLIPAAAIGTSPHGTLQRAANTVHKLLACIGKYFDSGNILLQHLLDARIYVIHLAFYHPNHRIMAKCSVRTQQYKQVGKFRNSDSHVRKRLVSPNRLQNSTATAYDR